MPRSKTPPPSPETLTALHLKCVVCTEPIPDGRVRRRKDTCSPECYELLRHYRASLFKLWRCPTCLAPNTPQQREEFKIWRQSQGRRITRGKPPVKREQALTKALSLAITLAEDGYQAIWKSEEVDGTIPDDVAAFDLARMRELIDRCKLALEGPKPFLVAKPVDTAPAERDSISADNQPSTP